MQYYSEENKRQYEHEQKLRALEKDIRNIRREIAAQKAIGGDTTCLDGKLSRKVSSYNKLKNYGYSASQYQFMTLGAADAIGDCKEPIKIGQIDIAKKEEAIKYFGGQIRNSEKEHLYVIDKNGNVYYNEGANDSVSIGNLDLADCTVLHNHPMSNGIVSFGEDDFFVMRDYQTASFRLVNRKYNYYAEVIKPLDDVTYNKAWIWSLDEIDINKYEDSQHLIMSALKKRGYLKYAREEIDR